MRIRDFLLVVSMECIMRYFVTVHDNVSSSFLDTLRFTSRNCHFVETTPIGYE